MPSTPRRRPLPARVYWARRTAVLGTVLALVFAVARLFLPHAGDSAAPVASRAPAVTPTTAPQPTSQPASAATQAATTPTPTAAATPTLSAPTSVPTGPCSDDKVTVTPAAAQVTGGGDVVLPLALTTTTGTSACTWKVSASALVVKISQGQQKIWSSQDCPNAIGAQDVVVRPVGEQPTQVQVPWGGRHSVPGCAVGQTWADPGRYTLTAASLGGVPADARLQVVAPPRPVVTKTAKPKKQKTPKTPVATPTG